MFSLDFKNRRFYIIAGLVAFFYGVNCFATQFAYSIAYISLAYAFATADQCVVGQT